MYPVNRLNSSVIFLGVFVSAKYSTECLLFDPQIIPKKIERDESCSGLIGLSKNISEPIRNLIELQGHTQPSQKNNFAGPQKEVKVV